MPTRGYHEQHNAHLSPNYTIPLHEKWPPGRVHPADRRLRSTSGPEQTKDVYKVFGRVVLLCCAWYTFSAGGNVIGKTLLTHFPYPVTMSFSHILSIILYVRPIMKLWGVSVRQEKAKISTRTWFLFIVPLALGKATAQVASYFSIWKVSVSYAHTVKALMPIFTVLLSRVFLGEKQTPKVYMSLVPIIIGVLIATMTELSFEMIGLLTALSSTIIFAVQNIFSKKVLKDNDIHPLYLLYTLGKMAALFLAPIWLITDARHIIVKELAQPAADSYWFWCAGLLFVGGLTNVLQNIVAFSLLYIVSPLSYSVANATKRILVIVVSLLMLRNPITAYNAMGMGVAILGVFFYNLAKLDANKAKKTLPYQMTELDLTLTRGNDGYINYNNGHHTDMRQDAVLIINGDVLPPPDPAKAIPTLQRPGPVAPVVHNDPYARRDHYALP